MTVYVVMDGDYDNDYCVAVYARREHADAYARRYPGYYVIEEPLRETVDEPATTPER